MSKQRVFKPNYLLRGKQHNKRSSTLFQLQKYDCHMLIPSPLCFADKLKFAFFSVFLFLIRWESRKCSRLCRVIGWLPRQSFSDIFGGGGRRGYYFHFTQQRTCWNFRLSARAFGDKPFKRTSRSNTKHRMCFIHDCLYPRVSLTKRRDEHFVFCFDITMKITYIAIYVA